MDIDTIHIIYPYFPIYVLYLLQKSTPPFVPPNRISPGRSVVKPQGILNSCLRRMRCCLGVGRPCRHRSPHRRRSRWLKRWMNVGWILENCGIVWNFWSSLSGTIFRCWKLGWKSLEHKTSAFFANSVSLENFWWILHGVGESLATAEAAIVAHRHCCKDS